MKRLTRRGLIALMVALATVTVAGCNHASHPDERSARTSEEAATPSPSPTETTTATPSPTATPTATPSRVYYGWDQVVANPPEGLKEAVNGRAGLTWDWDDVLVMGSYRLANGQAPTALVGLIAQNDEGGDPRTDAQLEQGIPLFQLTTSGCRGDQGSNACPDPQEGRLLLLPVVANGDGTYTYDLDSGGLSMVDDEVEVVTELHAVYVE